MKKPKWVVEKERLRKSEKKKVFFFLGFMPWKMHYLILAEKIAFNVTKMPKRSWQKAIEVSELLLKC